MRIYDGKKPCPGCGVPGTEKKRYGADELCRDCKDLIELGKGVKADKAGEYSSIALPPYTFGFLEYYVNKTERHATERPPYISDTDYGKKKGGEKGSSKDVLAQLRKLLESMDLGVKDKVQYQIKGEDSWNQHRIHIHTDTAIAVFNLVDSLAVWGHRLQKEGYADGYDLLKGLASGEMTLSDFEERKKRYK